MRLVAGIYLFLICISGISQEMVPDTILNLNDVTIYSSRISRFAKGQSVLTVDSLTRTEYPSGSLAELMNGFTSTYIRNYGQGTLSTLSFRGTSANHAGLLWNGIRVSPPNIGYVDLSLVQNSYFDNISILYGGASPMFGSGSIGGGIHLESRPVFGKFPSEFSIGLSAGSFGTMAIEGNSAVSTEKIYSRTAVSLMNSTNNFSYKDLQGENRHLPHAAIFKGGFMQDVAFRLPNNQYIMASEWFQYAGRDIPPTLTEENSEASEIDRSWRTMVSWKNFHEKGTMEAKVAYFNEYTLYKDPLASVYSTIQSQTISGSFENTWDIGKNSSIFGGTQFTYEYADLDYYEKPEDQENLAIFASYRYNIPSVNWQFSLNGRQEFLTVFHPPFLFSIGGEGKIWRFISARFNVSRNFRAPTLNERFWQPGGNPDLKPEESWNEEVGILLENHFASSGIKLTLTAFNSRVENWILWLPGGSYWSVENAGEVWARGIEVIGEQSLKLGEVKIFFSESYSYTKATNEKKLFELDASYKKQLIYTPVNRFVIRAGLTSEGYNITLKGNFTGEVFTTKDNLESLPSTFLLDAVFSKSFKMKKIHPLTLQLNLNNILNTDYQSVPYRPMPGINFLVTCRMAFGKLKIKN